MIRFLFVLLLLLLLLGACASQNDVRQEQLYACESYTASLRKINVWKDAGKLNDDQKRVLRQVAESTTPLCMTETPTASSNMLVTQAVTALEELSARILLEQ